METNQRRVGRPKAPPRTGPLVLGDDRGRTKVTLEISASVADELMRYSRWVEEHSGLSANEARLKTVDFAFSEVFRRDRLWQVKQHAPTDAAPASSAPTPLAPTRPVAPTAPTVPRAAAAASPSLPPAAPREPRANP